MRRADNGDVSARDELYTALYGDLREVARRHLSRAGTLSLDPSAVLHECWLRMERGQPRGELADRRVFFGYASTVMRNVIIDHVRERRRQKRSSGERDLTLDTAIREELPAEQGILAMDDALRDLARFDERSHRVVEMRYFGGLTEDEIAEVLGVSVPTVKRDWRKARAFLIGQLQNGL